MKIIMENIIYRTPQTSKQNLEEIGLYQIPVGLWLRPNCTVIIAYEFQMDMVVIQLNINILLIKRR